MVAEVRDELRGRADAAIAAGVDPTKIILDPGLGFAKRAEHNWRLTRAPRRDHLALGFPVLVGASRKSYLGALLADPTERPRPAAEREAATVATSVLAVAGRRVGGAGARRPGHGRRAQGPRGDQGRPMSDQPRATDQPRRATGARATTGCTSSSAPRDRTSSIDVRPRTRPRPGRRLSDDVADTVHYGELADRLVAIVAGEPVHLIETLAARSGSTPAWPTGGSPPRP